MGKAVIFDVDGTLLDTERIYMQAWKDAAAELGYVMPDSVLQKTRAVNAKDAAKIFEAEIGGGFSYEKTRPIRVRIAEEIIERESPILKPGVLELLEGLGVVFGVGFGVGLGVGVGVGSILGRASGE